jgi:glycosyltransferase involved in cell wall biosynthesis/O-antigen/teichoic acid export membrane protein
MTNTKTIARNTGWFSIENVINAIVLLVTSIAINRYLGPQRNGYLAYVSYIANLVSGLGGMGIPAATRKYMAEFIGMGDRGTARYIYLRTIVLQIGLATLATSGFLFWALRDASSDYELAAALMVLSIWPSMINSISAQANTATEDLSKNLAGSIAAASTYFVAIAATVVFHWGVVGVGASMLIMRCVDLLVRFFPTMKRVLAWETTHAHPTGLRRRMMPFALQAVGSMFVAQIVWGRSEVLILKHLYADISQVSYYSIAFTMAEQLLLVATIFGTASGATIFVQYGRDKSKLPELAASTFRYIAMMSIPLHLIAVSLAVPALLLFYGHKFEDAAMVVTLAPLLCMFKAFVSPAQNLLESMERQRYVIAATVIAGVIDIGVAWYLIPAHGAVGACIGNGAAQLMAVGIMWAVAIRLYKVKLPWALVAKVAFISALASLAAHFIAVRMAPLWAILCGGSAALIVLFGLLYLMRVFELEDHQRFMTLAGMLPQPIVRPAGKLLSWLTRPEVDRDAPAYTPAPAMSAMPAADREIKISVVIPAYNAAAFLPRCLESVFAQTLKPAEVIVVDDGSTDNTAALAEELGARVIRRPNGGQSAARNMGIQSTSSEWIALLDADDTWALDKLERQIARIRPDTVLVYTGIRIFDDNGERSLHRAVDALSARKMLRHRNPITPSTTLIRRDIFLRSGGFREDIRACEDWELWVRLLQLGQFEAVPEALTNYYVYPNSFSANPVTMLRALDGIIETTLLAGRKGIGRWLQRRRIRASQLCSASLIARENGLKGEFAYMFRSLYAWPSPFWEPRRYAFFAAITRNAILRRD